jgi:hypothetical protein
MLISLLFPFFCRRAEPLLEQELSAELMSTSIGVMEELNNLVTEAYDVGLVPPGPVQVEAMMEIRRDILKAAK